jgi:FlaA1/EpsC-like NDP-sugar epimerase
MKVMARLRNRAAAFTHDILVIPIAWFGAFWLRFNLEAVPLQSFASALNALPIIAVVHACLFWYFGLYRGIWRFASMPDLVRIAKAIVAGVFISAALIFLISRMHGIPRSVLPIYALLLMVLLGGPRFFYRWLKDHKFYGSESKKALIVGAGSAGEALVRDLLRDVSRDYEPIGFIDDDPKKRGQDMHGIRVLGSTDEIPHLSSTVDIILIALPSADPKEMRRVVGICEKTGISFRTLPRFDDVVTGRISIKALRDVKIDDLLGREAVKLEWDAIRKNTHGKTILVSGGGGSIGSELCRQIAAVGPSHLVVLDNSEFNLYSIEMELRQLFPDLRLLRVLGDVGDVAIVEKLLHEQRPEIIFHAAAYKHVPMLEDQVRAAVRNNILGTRTIVRLADKYGCKTFVLISTDKAVNPGNIMGATKHVAEIYCQSMQEQSKTQFITVRFGNVLGSAGSVIPLFQKQIAQGGPVTVTDPNVTRYFMTIPEAAQLILQASSIGRGGEIFVLDMGEPVNIKYLAEQLIMLSGKRAGDDIEIVYTGLRPGEKPYEELFHQSEELVETPHPKTLLARSRKIALRVVEEEIDAMAEACKNNDESELRQRLTAFVSMSARAPEVSDNTARLSLVYKAPQ